MKKYIQDVHGFLIQDVLPSSQVENDLVFSACYFKQTWFCLVLVRTRFEGENSCDLKLTVCSCALNGTSTFL